MDAQVNPEAAFETQVQAPVQGKPVNPVQLAIDYPESLSWKTLLLKTFLGWAYVGIPHGIVLAFYGFAVCIVLFIGWFVILFTGKLPRWMFNFTVGYLRWYERVVAYLMMLTDVYPPFRASP
jgi:hypothetical protein